MVEAEEEPTLVTFQCPFGYMISTVSEFQDMFPPECCLLQLLLTMLSIWFSHVCIHYLGPNSWTLKKKEN